MNEQGAKPVLRSTILLRIAMVLLLLAALSVAIAPKVASLFRAEPGMTTSGDPADIRLVGIVPDGDNVLLDARGKAVPGVKLDWPGNRTYTWPQNSMLREFVFELGPDLADLEFHKNNPVTVALTQKNSWSRRSWIPNTTYSQVGEPVLLPDGRRRFLFSASMSQNYWRRGLIIGSRQPPVDEIDVELRYYGNTRGLAALNYDGPFAVGKTNSARESKTAWLTPLAVSLQRDSHGALFEIALTGYGNAQSRFLAYDTAGKRHLAQHYASTYSASNTTEIATGKFLVAGLQVEKIATITFDEHPVVKRFHNILVKYPDRPPRAHAVALDRLAVALGKTNAPAASLEHFSPSSAREAMAVLEHMPGHRNAVVTLANANSTNLSELTPAQHEKLRRLAAVWANMPNTYERDTGLRLGLRGGWPEFLALAMTRLTNSSAQDRVHAANTLAWTRTQIGANNVPPILAIARTNTETGINSSLLAILQRAGPAGTNALLALAGADAPYLWWGAMNRLPTRAFEPVDVLSQEMQERVWLVKQRVSRASSNAVVTAALARLPGLLTPELRRGDTTSFSSALRRLQRYVDRPTAMAAMMKFLRDLPPEQVKYQPPAELVQQVNAWYGQDFGGLGATAGNASNSPKPDEWPGIVEDVLKFYEKLKREGRVAAEN